MRAVAALRIEAKPTEAEATARVGKALLPSLSDPVRAVRVGAVLSLVNLRVGRPSDRDGERFDRARQEYIDRARIQSDDGPEQFTLGGFQLFSGDPAAAVQTYQNALRLDERLPAKYFLGAALWQLKRKDEAVAALRAVLLTDPYFAAARGLLDSIP